MANLFGNLTTDNLEEATDSLGGRNLFPSGAYIANIKAMFVVNAKSGAKGMTILANIDGKDYTETIYFTNKEGKNFFLSKQDPTKKIPLPGFTVVNDLCLVGSEKPLSEQEFEKKVHNVYDPDLKKEVPQNMETDMDMLNKPVGLCILNEIVDKTTQQGDKYVATGETTNRNRIVKVFHPELRVTISEAKNNKPAEFIDKWIKKYAGVEVNSAKGALPQASKSNTSAATPRKSLFSK